MVRPVDARYPVTLGYRQKMSSRPDYIHRGIDYGCPTGTEVHATQAGVVVTAGTSGGYGPAYGVQVVVRVGDVWCLYAHLSKALVRAGERVETGQAVGLSGATGNVTGAHLHYQENTQPPAAYKSDRAPQFIDTAGDAPMSTVFDASHWSQAHYPWFSIPWWKRIAGIGKELRGTEAGTEASVHTFTELYSEETANSVLAELRKNGDDFRRALPAGRVGMELMYDASKWELASAKNYPSGIQNRYLYVVYLRRKSTGKTVVFIVGHAPIRSDYDKQRWGRWAAGIVASITDAPRFIAWDFNRNPNGESPRKEIEALGFRSMRSQAAIANESADEFPSRGWSLADIYTIPSEARITGGQIDLTSASLSDHRRLEARIVIPA